MRLSSVIVLLSLLNAGASAQEELKQARPEVGWDSLKSLIQYPLLARRAALQGYADVTVELDAGGNVLSVQISGYDIYHEPIEHAVRSVKWLPLYRSGPTRGCTVYFEVRFTVKGHPLPTRQILDVQAEPWDWSREGH